ncbi:MAG TPA: asparagine synthase (glutamine-hydrolyzing), partial [Candidatus Omnitrophota bacterium]|nr:asparagine synthase (glutamine-hydrolyzing) [Candidatus Omnitrophota bacterium]
MCGICGILNYSGSTELKTPIDKMLSKLEHRGPDDQGVFFDGFSKNSENSKLSLGLGHKRLSIIDLHSGHQPMHNEDKTVTIVLNGEIYNYLELKTELQKKGHRFSTTSDTEVVIHLYEEYGRKCVDFLRGMFAFAIWDSRAQGLFLARDRAGKKPLVYYYKNGLFAFSSEIASLLESGFISKELDQNALDYYLSLGYIPAPLTIFKNVYKLSHAHTLFLTRDKLEINRYWDLDYTPKLALSEPESERELAKILEESVRIRLRSDVPLGAFLSGGVDSSAIVSLMSSMSPQRVKTFTIGFEEKNYSELRYARTISKLFNTDHHEFVVKPDALHILPLLVERYGEPYADSSAIPSYYVSRETRKFVTVALNGDGGDESFAGYERYHAMLMAERYRSLPRALRAIAGSMASCLPDSADSKNTLRRIRRFLEAATLPADKRYLRWVGIWNQRAKESLYSTTFKTKISANNLESKMGAFINEMPQVPLVDRLLKTDVSNYLPYDLLVKVDIASMANSLEARSPLLDHKLMEFAARLPVQYKLKGTVKKYILKKYLEKSIPKQNLYRTKMGFAMPVGDWLRG